MDNEATAAFFVLNAFYVVILCVFFYTMPWLTYEYFKKMRKKEEEKAAEKATQRRQAESERTDYEAFEAWRAKQLAASDSESEIMPGIRLNPDFAADTNKKAKPKRGPSENDKSEWY